MMMKSARTGRMRRRAVPWGMTRLLMMRLRPPRGRRQGAPSRPLSHVGPEGPTRGSRATPVPVWRWRRGREITVPMTWGARGPRSTRALRTLPTFGWTTVIGPLASVSAGALGSGWTVKSGRGGVRRRLGSTVSWSRAITCRPLAGAAVVARVTACSFCTGLMLSPWRLSVARGTQLLQCVGAHVPLGNSGTHGWLRWSVTLQLLPI